MHLVIPFAAVRSDAGRAALRDLQLPQLARRLAGRTPQHDRGEPVDGDEELSLNTPHDRALARAWGWSAGDGLLPFAAHAARADGVDTGERPWGLLTPVHWHAGAEQVSLSDPAELPLSDADSRDFFDTLAPLFTSEGFVMRWGAADRWYLSHDSLAGLATASLDRVVGRNVDRWLPGGRDARLWRRLQNECQMVLHTHPLNAARETARQPTVNSLWLSGCGVGQPVPEATAAAVRVDLRLRAPALAGEWADWRSAWADLDRSLADPGLAQLTLCGEAASATFDLSPLGTWAGWRARWQGAPLAAWLEAL